MAKGQIAPFSVQSIPDFIYLGFFFTALLFLIAQQALPPVDTLSLDAPLIVERLLHSPEGISYVDPLTQRVYPSIIDENKLLNLEQRLDTLLFFDAKNEAFAAKITIDLKEYYYNQNEYDRWSPQAGKPTVGGRKKSISSHTMTTLLKQKETLVPVTLTIEVVARP